MAVDCVYSLGCSLLLEVGSRCNFEIQEGQDYDRQRYRKDFDSLVVISGIQQDFCSLSCLHRFPQPLFFHFLGFPFGGDLQLILSFCRCPLLIASLFD